MVVDRHRGRLALPNNRLDRLERRNNSVQRREKNPMDLTGVLFRRDQKGKDDAQSGGISMAESIHVGIIVPELSDM